MKKLKLMLLIGLIALSMGLYGCEGDDGSAGPAGAPGAPGADSPAANTQESCNVCHEEGALAGMELNHELDGYPGVETVTIDDVAFANSDGSAASVTFSVTDAAGLPKTSLPTGDVKVAITKLVPGTGNEFVWVPYIYRAEDTAGSTAGPNGTPVLPQADQATGAPCVFTATATPGQYTCALPDISAVTTPNGDSVSFEPTLTHRVGIYYYTGHDFPIGGGDTDFVPNTLITDPTATFAAAEAAVVDTRDIATIESCNECHGLLQGHGGDRFTVRNCVLCHNPGTTDANSGLTVDMSSMIHSIHRGEELALDYTIWGHNDGMHNYNEVLYPEELTNCEKCHTASDPATPDGDNWNIAPTILACTGCHDDVSFESPVPAGMVAHKGGAQTDNSGCATCHSSTAIEGYHDPVPAPANVAEFDVTIDMEAPANGTHYVEGEAPVVTVTLAATDGGLAVDYTAAPDEPGDRDGMLHEAELTVYGPRAHADEVLGGGGSLLLPTEDAQVLTDETGFKYQLQAIPADMEPGTYMVHFEGGDYGPVSDTDYQTHSAATQTFQVGTATAEPKVAGDCTTCHGDTRIHVEGAHPHNVPYDTDACLACHNYSGGYGTPLPQRVHAVHSASDVGADGHGRAWTEVTFPQATASCEACHNSGKTSFIDFSGDRALACIGCHGDNTGTADHVLQNGGQL